MLFHGWENEQTIGTITWDWEYRERKLEGGRSGLDLGMFVASWIKLPNRQLATKAMLSNIVNTSQKIKKKLFKFK